MKDTYYINKGEHLSQVLPEIETNIVLAKKLPGIGATHMEINSPRPSILIEPNVPVIKGKCREHENVLGIYEDITADRIIRYFKEQHDYPKLISTPESFPKIKTACQRVGINMFNEFFFLMDESHKLVKDVDYRADIVLPMNDFFLFKNKALVSATPIRLTDPRFTEQEFRTVNIEATFDYQQRITAIHTNNILQSVIQYKEENNNPICFFINSIDLIHSLMKTLDISGQSAVFCAPKSQRKLKVEFDFKNSYDDWEANKMQPYSFFTGRFFNAFDLKLDYQPNVVMITDLYTSPHTMLDINTDCIQIAGRFRKGLSSLTHIYNTDRNIFVKEQEQIEWELSAHEHAYNTIKTFYQSASKEAERRAFGEAMESLPFNKLLYPDGSKNHFAIDNRIDEALVTNSYQVSDRIEEMYHNCYMFKTSYTRQHYKIGDFDQLVISKSKTTIKDKRKNMIKQLETMGTPPSEYEADYISSIRAIDPLIVEAYQLLGKDKIEELNYSTKKLNEAIILNKITGNKTVLLVKNSFKIRQKYTCKEIQTELTRIYEELNIHPDEEIQGKKIKRYFQAAPCKTRGERGYSLISELV